MSPLFSGSSRRWMLPVAVGLVLLCAIGIQLYRNSARARPPVPEPARGVQKPKPIAAAAKVQGKEVAVAPPAGAGARVVRLGREQQAAIGLTVVPAASGEAIDVIEAPGQIIPDETKFAYITPRAAGVVRAVAAHVGQSVHAGDLLALIDSPEVAQARFDLYTRLQELEIERAQAQWQETIYKNTLALVERLKARDSPEEIHQQFKDRPVGANREQLLTAYANYRLRSATMDRNRELIEQGVITPKQFQQVRAEFEAAQATYQSLMDQMEYNNRLANTLAQNALRRAETAVRVARERLRVLGVRPDGTEPEIKDGKVVGVRPDGSLPSQEGPEEPVSAPPKAILPESPNAHASPVTPVGAATGKDQGHQAKNLPVSAYALWAPFDGTVLDRELIVPGVFVDTTHRIFTIADLSTVWIEVNIHESHYGALSRSGDAELTIASPAYPGRTFKVEVIYTGDLVDPKSRTIKLLARADNPDRTLKPGMFVDVTMRLKSDRYATLIPRGALLRDDEEDVVYVRTGPEEFERRRVVAGSSDGDRVAILEGLKPGDQVVAEGGFKLKSQSIQSSNAAQSE